MTDWYKTPAERVTVQFDFSANTTNAQSVQINVVVAGGQDPAPSAIKYGSPTVNGGVVLQQVAGGLSGTDYLITCECDGDGNNHWQLSATLHVHS